MFLIKHRVSKMFGEWEQSPTHLALPPLDGGEWTVPRPAHHPGEPEAVT